MATSRRRPARSRAWAVAAAAAVCLSACSSEVSALSISDLTAIYEMPIKSINGWTKSALGYLPFNTPRWLERDSASPVDELVVEDHFPPTMPLELEGEDYVRTYPAFPHSPLVVAAATCDSVVLRWKSFDDDLWPVDAFLVERFPSLEVEPQWAVIADGNGTELVDTDVSPAFHYTYRVQVISKNTPSAFSYHWTRIRTSPDGKTCGVLDEHHLAASGLLGALQALTHHHSDAVRTLGLIFACFLTVYGLMRASVNGVQGTRSRSYRLKRIKKSASEGVVKVAAASSPATTRRSSSSSSSTPPSLTMDSSRSNPLDERQSLDHRRSVSLTTRESTAEDPRASLSREPSFRRESRSLGAGRLGEKAEYCQDCRKRFGMFRRRHLCDVCHSVTLCRKCGFQAPADSFSSSGGSVGGGHASSASSNAHKVKLRTICRSCCDEVYRYSTAPSVRPSLAAHHSA